MKKTFSLLLVVLSILLTAQNKKPKLVVGIVVDQMRNEYLNRFYTDFGANGFKRLLSQGYMYHNMHYNYMPTYTGPGHASVYTGTTPAIHGIVANEFVARQGFREIYCAQDDSVQVLGISKKEKEGKMSPKNLRTTTITDELKLATNFKAKVYGMSIKDRGAILPVGHFADFAFWFSDTGNFISSSFYNTKLPNWLEDFNSKKIYEPQIKEGWKTLYDLSQYEESLPDKNPYEAKLNNHLEPIFPYDLQQEFDSYGAGIIRSTPIGNNMLTELAKSTIINEQLGKDKITDFLAISYSSTDYVGHYIGPRSVELQDMYLRLDQNIADLLTFLDKNVGKGEYILFLTADHACSENSTFLHDHKYQVTSIDYKKVQQEIRAFGLETFGKDYLKFYENQNLYFDLEAIAKDGLDFNALLQKYKNFLENKESVRRAYTQEEILNPSPTDRLLLDIARGFDTKLSGEMVILYQPAYMEYMPLGTTHGTPYGYDTHVPALFFGGTIPKGENFEKQYITDIAPTIAHLLRITMPNGTEGKVLKEIIPTKK